MKNGKKVLGIVAMICLIATLGACLVGCAGMKDYQKKLEKAGYEVVAKEAEGEQKDAGAEWVVSARKGTDYVTVTKFKNEDDAKKYEEAAKAMSVKTKRSGKILIAGTEQGVKDAD